MGVWAVVMEDWHECGASVESHANADPRQCQLENCEINVPKENGKASEE